MTGFNVHVKFKFKYRGKASAVLRWDEFIKIYTLLKIFLTEICYYI